MCKNLKITSFGQISLLVLIKKRVQQVLQIARQRLRGQQKLPELLFRRVALYYFNDLKINL